MSDGTDLLKAILGLQETPKDSSLGQAGALLDAQASELYKPNVSSSRNLRYTVGTKLLGSVLNGLAQRQINNDNAEMYSKVQNLISADDAQRAALIQQTPELTKLGSVIQARQLNSALDAQEQTSQIKQMQRLMEKQGYVFDPTKGASPMDVGNYRQVYDPTQAAAERASARKQGELMGQQQVWGGKVSPEMFAKQAAALNNKLSSERATRDYLDTVANWQLAHRVANMNSAAGSLALVIAVAKVLDPTSVVRESEFKIASSVGAPAERLKGYWQSVINGDRLSDVIKQDMLRMVDNAHKARRTTYLANGENLIGNAERVLPGMKDVIQLIPEPKIPTRWNIDDTRYRSGTDLYGNMYATLPNVPSDAFQEPAKQAPQAPQAPPGYKFMGFNKKTGKPGYMNVETGEIGEFAN